MLLKGLAKEVPAFGICYKIEIVGRRRIEGRAQSSFARIGDRPGRQAPVPIRVVRRSEMQIAAVEFAGVRSRQGQRVRDRGIALQRLADAQPVFKHSGNVRPFFRARSLAFHKRSKRHDILNALVRRRAGNRQSQPLLPEFLYHRGGHVFSRHVARELIGRGEKKTFEAWRVGSNVANRRRVARGNEKFVAGKESFVCGKVRDIEHRKSLGNHEFLYEHAAIGDRVVHGERGHGTVEEILAGLQIVSPSLAAQKFKRDPAAHDAVFGEQARDRPLRRAARDIHVDPVAREPLIRLVQRQVEISLPPGSAESGGRGRPGAYQARDPVRARGAVQIISQDDGGGDVVERRLLFCIGAPGGTATRARFGSHVGKRLVRFPRTQPLVHHFHGKAKGFLDARRKTLCFFRHLARRHPSAAEAQRQCGELLAGGPVRAAGRDRGGG